MEPGPFPQSVRSCFPRAGPVLARCRRLPRGSGSGCPRSPPGAAMPSPSDSSRSLTGRTSRSLTHLHVQRTWLQILLVLGFIQVILGVLIVTFSLVAATITPSAKIRHSCPSWAGFSVSLGPGQCVEGSCRDLLCWVHTAPWMLNLLPVPGECSPACSPTLCLWLLQCIVGESQGLPQGDSVRDGDPRSGARDYPGYVLR